MTLTEESIFLGAIEKTSAEERAKYLDEACAGDPARRRLIERLLEAHARAQANQFLADRGPMAATLEQPVLERPGTQIGSYKLMEQIGEGGMGLIFVAEQHQPVRRKVALKVIKPGMDTRDVIARFEAERQALALMDHPNIARVLDAGATASGRPYFVMELVKGTPITAYCDENRLSPRERLELFTQVCHAVQHAHQKGIIHRDIKPNNVLVASHDGQPVVKVIDFGVAKAIGHQLTEHTIYTAMTQMVGTPLYMSPEQAGMSSLDIDTRTDIYSLGVLLYELLTGTTPFDKERIKQAAFDEIRRIIREEEPQKPSTRISTTDAAPSIAAQRNTEPAKLSKLVRGELDWIVMKALEKDRNRRYETANGFAMDIQRYLADEQVRACPPSAAYRLHKFARRQKAALAVAGVVLLLLVLLGSSIGWAVRDRAATAHEVAVQKATRQARLEQNVRQVLNEIEIAYRSGQQSEAMAALRQAEGVLADGEIGAELSQRVRRWRDDLEMAARLVNIRLERAAHSDDGKWDWSGADRAYQQAFRDYGLEVEQGDVEELAERIGAIRIAVEIAVALDDWADVRRRLPNSDETAWRPLVVAAQAADPDPLRNQLRSLWGRKIDEAQGEIEQLAASLPGKRLQPTTVVLLARVLQGAGLSTQAEALLREGQERYPSDFWINFQLGFQLVEQPPVRAADGAGFYRAALAVRPGNALVHSNLGFALSRQGKPAEAERAHREAIRLSPNYGRAYMGLGQLFWSEGKWEQAIANFEQAIKVDPENSYPYPALAKILTSCPEPTLRDYPRALDVAVKGAELSPQSTWHLQNLGWAEYRMGQWQAAIDSLEESCKLQGNAEEGDAFQWFFLAMANRQLGRTEEARRWYDKCFHHTESWHEEIRGIQAEAAEVLGIPSPPEQFFQSLAEARAHYDAGRWQEAIDAYSQVIEVAPFQAASTWRNRGTAYLELKQWQSALEDLTKSLEIVPENGWSWHARGRAFANLDQSERAIADFTRALEFNPRDWGALGNRGLAHIKLNQPEEAIADFSAAVAIYPGRAWLWQGRADAHAMRREWDQALADCAQAVQAEPGVGWIWRRFLEVCSQAQQWDQAVAEYDRMLLALPAPRDPWQEGHGVLEVAAESEEFYERLSKLRPADRPLRIARVKHVLKHGAERQASDVLAEVIALDPSDDWGWGMAAILYLEAGAVEEYRRVCGDMLRRFAETIDPLVAERTVEVCFLAPEAMEDLGPATKLAERAAATPTANPRRHLTQAMGEYRMGNHQGALERLQACLALPRMAGMSRATAWLVRSMAEHQLNRSAEARDSFAKAQELVDGQPQPDDAPLTGAWADHRRFDLLYQEAGGLLGLRQGERKAFVLVAGGAQVVEHRYDTLAAAVRNARDDDAIEVRGNGPFFSRPVAIGSRRLAIRAGEGFRPVIQFGANSKVNEGQLLSTSAALVLEGLEFHDGGLAETAPQYSAVIFSGAAPLHVANCRLVVRNQAAIVHYAGPVCQIRNCEFLGKPLFKAICDAGQQITIDNNLFPRSADHPMINVQPPRENVSIRLTRNSIQGVGAIQFQFPRYPGSQASSENQPTVPIQIESAGNVFDVWGFAAQFGFNRADGFQPDDAKAALRRIVSWRQQGDLFSLRKGKAGQIRASSLIGERFTAATFESLEDWKQFWGLPENSVVGGTVQYQGGNLQRRAESSPELLTPEDFRLTPGSAGYRAGADGKDLGPDLDLVGPGAAYERWKKTPEYEVWRHDTGQAR